MSAKVFAQNSCRVQLPLCEKEACAFRGSSVSFRAGYVACFLSFLTLRKGNFDIYFFFLYSAFVECWRCRAPAALILRLVSLYCLGSYVSSYELEWG